MAAGASEAAFASVRSGPAALRACSCLASYPWPAAASCLEPCTGQGTACGSCSDDRSKVVPSAAGGAFAAAGDESVVAAAAAPEQVQAAAPAQVQAAAAALARAAAAFQAAAAETGAKMKSG